MLHINNACIAFGTEVLFSGFEMKLEKGETACIVGQSGCGKTSLLNAVMGFVPLYEGTIKVGGTLLDKSTIDLVRRQIAWIPQELALPFEWVKEMVSLPFELKVNRSVPFSEARCITIIRKSEQKQSEHHETIIPVRISMSEVNLLRLDGKPAYAFMSSSFWYSSA